MKNRIYPWIVVGLLWVVALLNYMDRQMLSTMQEAMKMDIPELNKAEAFGALMAVFLWIYGIISPVAGIISDKMNRKRLVVGSLFVWSAVTLLMGYAHTFHQLYWLRAIMGISEALYIPSALSLIADWHTEHSRSLAVGIHATGLYAGQAVGGFGAAVAAALSWQTTFHWFGIIGIAYALILMLALRENPVHIAPKKEESGTADEAEGRKPHLLAGLAMLLSTWVFWVILIYFAAPSLPGWATKNWLPTLFSESLGISMTKAGPISTITIAFSSFLGVLIGGILSDRWVQKNIRGRVYTGAIGLGLTIPALVLLGIGHHIVFVVGAGLVFGIGYGMFDTNNMPILCQFVSARHRGTAYGLMNMTGVFAGAAVTKLMGKWTDGGNLGSAFALLSIVAIIALILQLYFLKPKSDGKGDYKYII